MMENPFHIARPQGALSPVLLSSPHSGQAFPLNTGVREEHLSYPQDTDWFVNELYGFGTELGCTQIAAKYSRYLIDLNRSADNHALYADGRVETGLIPLKSFGGDVIYDETPSEDERKRRLALYYHPYYEALEKELLALREKFGRALLLDCHSIRRFVPSIQEKPFPDLILGDANGKACGSEISQPALECLREKSQFEVAYNAPFKGGNITRHFGQPEKNIHALQLEMSQDLYMDEGARVFNPERALEVQLLLKTFVSRLIEWVKGK